MPLFDVELLKNGTRQ